MFKFYFCEKADFAKGVLQAESTKLVHEGVRLNLATRDCRPSIEGHGGKNGEGSWESASSLAHDQPFIIRLHVGLTKFSTRLALGKCIWLDGRVGYDWKYQSGSPKKKSIHPNAKPLFKKRIDGGGVVVFHDGTTFDRRPIGCGAIAPKLPIKPAPWCRTIYQSCGFLIKNEAGKITAWKSRRNPVRNYVFT